MEVFSLFVKNLSILDCAILDPQRGPIGMSWRVGVEFKGGLNKEGVVFDFSYAKKCAKKVIDSTADHAFIVSNRDVVGGYMFDDERDILTVKHGHFSYTAPKQAFFIIEQCTESMIFAELESEILQACKENPECAALQQVSLTYTDEQNEATVEAAEDILFYQYTHGLKSHYGNCQRLIHGHKSKIEVLVNDAKVKAYESAVASHFNDKHLVIQDNLTYPEDSELAIIKYSSSQGDFYAEMDFRDVISFPYETTVENISKYIANWLKVTNPELRRCKVTVIAYEGIEKGCRYEHLEKMPYTIDRKADYHKQKELLKG